MVKPVNKGEAVMWASIPVILVGAAITGLVQDNWNGAWALVCAVIVLMAAGGERRRKLQQREDSP